jgi:type II secretory pathway component PulM
VRRGEPVFDPEALPRVFRMTPRAMSVVAGAGLLLVVVAIWFLFWHPPWPLQAVAGLLAMFGVLGILDAMISRIVPGARKNSS